MTAMRKLLSGLLLVL